MSKTHLFSVNRSVKSLAAESRPLRLPTVSPFPKLNHRISRPVTMCTPVGVLPEMTTDVIDLTTGYAVENVKRDRGEARLSPRWSLGDWIGRLLGFSHRAARP